MAARHDGDEAPDRAGREVSTAEAKVEEWVDRWWEAMTRVAVRLLEDRDAADDVVQRAFMRALSIARTDPKAVKGIRNPSAWLLRITRNLASGVLRTEARRREFRRENGDEIRASLFAEPGAGGERDPRAGRVLKAAPRVLTKRQLEVFGLAWEGMDDEGIAEELGVKGPTVRWHRAEAIRKLRKHLLGGG